MNIHVLGLVENMSYAVCPDCGKHIEVFGPSHIAEEASKLGLPVLAQIPFDSRISALCDAGRVEEIDLPAVQDAAAYLSQNIK